MAKKEIEQLRLSMKKENIDAYIIVSNDFHGSEYVGDYFKCRQFISGFTGSAGTLLVTADKAFLWTDGRYFIQAKEQLNDSGIKLMKMGEPGVLSLEEFLSRNSHNNWNIGFDGRTVNIKFYKKLMKVLKEKNIKLVSNVDLAGNIWTDRPLMSNKPAWILGEEYSGMTRKDKLIKIREEMKKNNADVCILTALDEIAYLFNIRGGDVAYNPVVLSYAIITNKQAIIYAGNKAFSRDIRQKLANDNITILDYNMIYEDVKHLPESVRVMCDESSINAELYNSIPSKCVIIDKQSPVKLMKAVKNKVEMDNEVKAHVMDGVAVTKFIYHLKTTYKTQKITELDVCNILESYRKMGQNYLGQSFSPIAASAEHGAIVHYAPNLETNIELRDNNFLLLDTGGHYLCGTTDITRTIALGKLTRVQMEHYTAVLCGNLNLSDIYFKEGCEAAKFDYVARKPLWRLGLDYKHGTGHGVGYLLNVHEGPNGFGNMCGLKEGMITSDEPGVYIEGQYGIRLENLIMCVTDKETEYGKFLRMQVLTLVPFDRAAILPQMMSNRQLEILNNYHKRVYDTISPYLNEDEKKWLSEETKEIKR